MSRLSARLGHVRGNGTPGGLEGGCSCGTVLSDDAGYRTLSSDVADREGLLDRI